MALQHEPQKEAIVDNGAKFEPVGTTVLTTPQISNIGVAVNADGSVSVDSSVTGGNGIVKYDIRIYKDGVLYDVRLGQQSHNLNIDGLENGDYSVLIQVKNENGQLLSEKTQTFTINKPPAPTGVRTTGGLGNITLEWDWVDDVTATEIFASETDDIKTAKRLTKVTARMYTHEVGAKQVRYYWLRHTRGVNVGPFNQQSGIKGESAVNIDAELKLLNDELKKTLQGSFEAIVEVNNKTYSPYINIGKYIYHSDKNQFFVWDGAKYEPIAVEAEKIVGKLTAMQIATNAIQAQHLAANSVTTAKIATGAVTANEIATGAVGAKHVATQSLNASHIATKSLTANLLNVDSLSAVSADLGSVTAGSLKIGKLNGNFGTLFEVQSTGGFRLIARDATGGIELNSASRALHVWDGGAEVVRVGKLS